MVEFANDVGIGIIKSRFLNSDDIGDKIAWLKSIMILKNQYDNGSKGGNNIISFLNFNMIVAHLQCNMTL